MSSALEKAVTVLEAVVSGPSQTRASELGRSLGLSRQAAHRILQQLADSGLLLPDSGSEHYRVGPRLKRLALGALSAVQRDSAGHEVLADLVGKLGESCNLGILDGREAVYIDRVECAWPLRLQLQPGSRLPAHCTAIGKLLLAHLEPDDCARLLAAGPLARYTERTVTEPGKLQAQLAGIRAEGFALNEQEYMAGLLGIAVPVMGPDGQLLAGLAVHAPVARMDRSRAVGHLPALRKAAKRLGELLAED